jgi:hypothetical protein
MQEQIYQDNIFEDNRKSYLSVDEVDKYFISLEELKQDYIHKEDIAAVALYEITGKTKAGKFVCASLGSLDFVKQLFIDKYPKFQGHATIYLPKTREIGSGLHLLKTRTQYKEFTNIKELKEIE